MRRSRIARVAPAVPAGIILADSRARRFLNMAKILVVEDEHVIKLIFSNVEIHLDVVYIFVADQQLLQP